MFILHIFFFIKLQLLYLIHFVAQFLFSCLLDSRLLIYFLFTELRQINVCRVCIILYYLGCPQTAWCQTYHKITILKIYIFGSHEDA